MIVLEQKSPGDISAPTSTLHVQMSTGALLFHMRFVGGKLIGINLGAFFLCSVLSPD